MHRARGGHDDAFMNNWLRPKCGIVGMRGNNRVNGPKPRELLKVTRGFGFAGEGQIKGGNSPGEAAPTASPTVPLIKNAGCGRVGSRNRTHA